MKKNNIDKDNFENEVINAALKINFIKVTNSSYLANNDTSENDDDKDQFSQAIDEANKILKKKSVLDYICPLLKSISGDLKEAAKIVTTMLLPISFTATPLVPLNPIIYGAITVIIVRAGINSICQDDEKKIKS